MLGLLLHEHAHKGMPGVDHQAGGVGVGFGEGEGGVGSDSGARGPQGRCWRSTAGIPMQPDVRRQDGWVAQVFKPGLLDSILVRVIARGRASTNRPPLGPGESMPRV